MNGCYTYFNVSGEFDPEDVSAALGLEPFRAWKSSDLRRDGKPYGFSNASFCRCDEYDFDINVMLRKTLAKLTDTIEILNALRERTDATFELRAVPSVYVNESTPALGLDLDIIDFCHATRTSVDIDMYVFNE